MSRKRNLLWVCLLGFAFAGATGLRTLDIQTYPVLGPDEGLWNVEAKDAVLFGDRTMSKLPMVFVAPLCFAVNWCLFHVLPATCFSVRLASACAGMLSLVLVAWLLARRYGAKIALTGVVLLGSSFVMVLINRRAYLESGVIFLSLLALAFADRRLRGRYVLLGCMVTLIFAYKANAVYLVPCLLLPIDNKLKDVFRRLVAVVLGVLGGLVVIYAVARLNVEESSAALAYEITKGGAEDAVFRVGRFGLYPQVLGLSLASIVRDYTDLVALSLAGVVGFVITRAWRDLFALRLMVWLLVGYAFLFAQSWQHTQYFAPLVIPAGLLVVVAFARIRGGWTQWGLGVIMIGTMGFSLLRMGVGWSRAHDHNPPLAAVQWIERQSLGSASFLAGPEVVIGTEKKGYPFSRIFHPQPLSRPPRLVEFVRDKNVKYVIFDEWETAPYFRGEDAFLAELSRFRKVAEAPGWRAYEVPTGSMTEMLSNEPQGVSDEH